MELSLDEIEGIQSSNPMMTLMLPVLLLLLMMMLLPMPMSMSILAFARYFNFCILYTI
jgi:hypothetical protein